MWRWARIGRFKERGGGAKGVSMGMCKERKRAGVWN